MLVFPFGHFHALIHVVVPLEVFPDVFVQAVHLFGKDEHLAYRRAFREEVVIFLIDIKCKERGISDDYQRIEHVVGHVPLPRMAILGAFEMHALVVDGDGALAARL